jgi:hypothetical protein
MNGLMALPNRVDGLLLSRLAVRETREFFVQPAWHVVAAPEAPTA